MTRRAALSLLAVACAGPPPLPEPALEAPAAETPPPGAGTGPRLDRAKAPAAGPEPVFHPPRAERFALANGLEVRLVEQHEIPVASFVLVVRGAGSDADPAARTGLAQLVADLVDEGAGKLAALDLADEIATMGATLATSADWDAAYVRMDLLARTLDQALRVFSSVVAEPTFAKKEVERVRADRLTEILERRSEPREVARDLFAAAVYGDAPYGQAPIGRVATLRAVRGRDVRAFWRARYRPDAATLVVAGDVTRASLEPLLAKTLGAWKAPGPAPTPTPLTGIGEGARIVLVDRAGAPQSELRVGHASVPRTHADYAVLGVLNTVLGGTFSARLNNRLREQLGFTYGAGSRFDWRRGPGPFVVASAIKTEHTGEAVAEILAQIARIRDEAVGDEELSKARRNLARSLNARFEASSDAASELADLAAHGLPDDWFETWLAAVQAVTPADVQRAARAHLDSARLVIAIVGDRKAVEPGLGRLGRGVVVECDDEGRPKK